MGINNQKSEKLVLYETTKLGVHSLPGTFVPFNVGIQYM